MPICLFAHILADTGNSLSFKHVLVLWGGEWCALWLLPGVGVVWSEGWGCPARNMLEESPTTTPCRTGAQESCWGGWNSSKVGLEPWRVPSPRGGSTPVSKAKSLRRACNPGPSSTASLTHICSIYLTAQGHPYSSLARSVCPVCSLGQQAPTRSTKHISAHLLPARPSLTPLPHHHHHSCGMQNTQQSQPRAQGARASNSVSLRWFVTWYHVMCGSLSSWG